MSHWPSAVVIVPVLNGEQTLSACLQALQTQTYPGAVQLVVINDGSTDRTSEVARSFSGVMVIDQKNQGRAAARNRGILESAGDVLAFTDADCIPNPDWLNMLVRRLREHKRRGIVGGAVVIPPGANIWQRLDHQAWAHSTGPDSPAGPTLFASTASMCLWREVFTVVGGFDFRLRGSEDSDLAFRVHCAGYENFFEPAAVIEHCHPRTTLASFLRQRYNYGKWTIQTVLKHKPLPPYSRLFPNSRILLALLWPAYAVLATGFTVLRAWRGDRSVIWLSPLHWLGRTVEYLGTIAGCGEYQRKFGPTDRARHEQGTA
ncbi:MAG: glycosyltransferase [Desulfuromonadaceae bacterium]|nr:glycosyltransferase [Desulfuromonadaceae bacterium]MDD5104095.1 glycosyltransferase [Desulfuromonadaceae bacterium]